MAFHDPQLTAMAAQGLVKILQRVSRRFSAAVALMGLLVLLGWWFKIDWLKSVIPGLPVMKPVVAVGFVMAGLALWWDGRSPTSLHRRSPVPWLAIACLGLGLWGLVIEWVLYQSHFNGSTFPSRFQVDRLPENTALIFVCFGTALLLLRRQRYRWGQSLALVMFYVAFAGFLGYLYDVRLLYGLGSLTAMALHTSLAFMVLAIALLLRHPHRGIATLLTAQHAGGKMVRRVLLTIIATPTLLCGFILWGARQGWYSAELSVVLLCLLTVLLLSLLTWWHGSLLEESDYYASRDNLTGLFNRRYFEKYLSTQTVLCRRQRHLIGLLFIDIDRFKRINDVLGHHLGDQLLIAIGERLQSGLPPFGLLARWGADEFIVLLPRILNLEEAAAIAYSLQAVLALPFTLEQQQIGITASFGVAIFPEDGEDYIGLLQKADLALYEAKKQGRNNLQVYSSTFSESAAASLKLENSLLKALDLEEFSLHYQPQINLQTGTITGFEALLRWFSPELGQVSPEQFIPVAEESGLIQPMGEWVMRQVCQQGMAWYQQGILTVPLGVNVSVRQFHHLGFLSLVDHILAETALPPALLEIEVTETTAMRDIECVQAKLYQLEDAGVSLAIDDFGTGFSSLAYLQHFPLHRLKIDRSFIHGMAQDPTAQGIVRSIVELGHNLSLRVIAEGVETREQMHLLNQVGCDEAQGFYFARPMSANETTTFLQRVSPFDAR